MINYRSGTFQKMLQNYIIEIWLCSRDPHSPVETKCPDEVYFGSVLLLVYTIRHEFDKLLMTYYLTLHFFFSTNLNQFASKIL